MYKFVSEFLRSRPYKTKDTLIALSLINTILLLTLNMDEDNIRILLNLFKLYSFLGLLSFHCISIGPFIGLGIISLINKDFGRDLAEEMNFNFWDLVSSLEGGLLFFAAGTYSLIVLCLWWIIGNKDLTDDGPLTQIMSILFWLPPLIGLAAILKDKTSA
jgi:hypothetical protein